MAVGQGMSDEYSDVLHLCQVGSVHCDLPNSGAM